MVNFERAKQKYNDIMYDCALDFLTIGTKDTEDAENKNKWNIRDLVAECAYQLSMYSTEGTLQYNDLHNPGNGGARNIHSPQGTARYCRGHLRGFVNQYKKYVEGVKAHESHCSDEYD